MSDRAIRKVPGFGVPLKGKLKELGWTQAALAKKAGLSRQTISRALTRDEVSQRTMDAVSAALNSGSADPSPRNSSDSGGRGRVLILGSAPVDGTDLVAWADRREAQSLLPRLIRRLVLVTGGRLTRAQFRADEGVQLSGWDGVVETEEATAFVPQGNSGWEIGVGSGPRSKADDDIAKRSAKPGELLPSETTFVFVTPRRFAQKEEWAAAQKKHGVWRDVRFYDADDLATWLEEAPAVHAWLSEHIGKTPAEAQSLESFWDDWSHATRPAIDAPFLLAGRGDEASAVEARLTQASQPFAIQSESRAEAVAILAAVIATLPDDEAEAVRARALVVHTPTAFRHLIASPTPLLLVPMFDADELVPAASRAGHAVAVPLGDADVAPEDAIKASSLPRRVAAEQLERLGVSHDRSYEMAGLARRSLTAFRRSIAAAPVLGQPEWSKPSHARGLLPALLAGSWSASHPIDREVLAGLARRPYDELQDELIAFTVGADPLVRRRGDSWYLVSREDAWRLLARYLTRDDLGRFQRSAVEVLTAVHPSFDLPPDQRWMAGALGRRPDYSPLLLAGLAGTVLIMGARGDGHPTLGDFPRDIAASVVTQVLEQANADSRIWASLSRVLPLLAEAAPDEFLDAVEEGLRGQDPVLAHIFDGENAGMFGKAYHSGLLWALETTAWSPAHLGRVARVLASLDRADPGSKLKPTDDSIKRWSNRPLASLQGIFRSWLPQTAAPLDARLTALDRLRDTHPEVAWSVLYSMLPEHHGTAFPNHRPAVRDWKAEGHGRVTYGERNRTTKEVVQRLLADVGTDSARWTQLIERLHIVSAEEHQLIVDQLAAVDVANLEPSVRVGIWEGLRAFVGTHRAFRSADWALPEEYVERLDELRTRFEPSDPVARYGWLFGYRPELPDSEDVLATPHEQQEERILRERVLAAEDVFERSGIEGLIALASTVEQPGEVGRAAATVPACRPHDDHVLREHLADQSAALASFAHGYAYGRLATEGAPWVLAQLEREDLRLSPDQQAGLLLILPITPETWAIADRLGDSTADAYWRHVRIYGIAADDVVAAARRLMEAGRPFSAIEVLGYAERKHANSSPELIADTLEAALSAEPAHERPGSMFSYASEQLLDALSASGFDEMRVARLEWSLLPVLDRYNRSPRTLHRLLGGSPEFFVEVVSLVYRSEEEEQVQLTEADEARAHTGYSLLTSWRRVPGYRDGEIDRQKLHEWSASAREKLAVGGRLSVGDQVIGQVLSSSPADPDGTWPAAAVRDLIEEVESRDLDTGIYLGVVNGRGVFTKDPAEGGVQERALAERYAGLAQAVSVTHPRTARILRRIADSYRRDASREDHEADMGQDLDL